ncbi:hypothetical protein ABK040_007285 [Willaertia magna]
MAQTPTINHNFNNNDNNKINLIIDTDIGSDDLFAITCLLTQKQSIKIHAISVVKGLQLNIENAIGVLIGMHNEFNCFENGTKIFHGYEERLNPVTGHCFSEGKFYYEYHLDKIHAEMDKYLDLQNFTLQDSLQDSLQNSLQNNFTKNNKIEIIKRENFETEMLNLLKNMPDNYFTLFCIGPLTNIAKLILTDKSLVLQKIKKVIIMGGALNVIEETNFQNGSEWNFFCDADAAKIVLSTFRDRIFLFHLKVVNLNVISNHVDELNELCKPNNYLNNNLNNNLNEKISDFTKFQRKIVNKLTAESVTYDTATSTFLLKPNNFKIVKANVIVETESPKEGIIRYATSKEEEEEMNNDEMNKNVIPINCSDDMDKEKFFEMIKTILMDQPLFKDDENGNDSNCNDENGNDGNCNDENDIHVK